MNTTKKAPVLVVVQLTGGNDFMNTLIPYTSGIYHDSRPVVGIKGGRRHTVRCRRYVGLEPARRPTQRDV